MSDTGRKLTDMLQTQMERRVNNEYNKAVQEIGAKITEYWSRYDAEEQRLLSEYKAGNVTMKEIKDWRVRNYGMGKRWEELRDTLSKDLTRTREIAQSIVTGYMPEAYALNYNYGAFAIERMGSFDTSFSLIDRNMVERLLRVDPTILPNPSEELAEKIISGQVEKWDMTKLQSAMIQGCLLGDSTKQIATRFQNVVNMDRRQALRSARTAMTGAASAGRHSSYVRAKEIGVKLTEEWSAVQDHVTRDSHRDMDGERKEVDEPVFSNGCRFPGDPYGDPKEVYNCRCDLIAWVKGYEPSEWITERFDTPQDYYQWVEEKQRERDERARGGIPADWVRGNPKTIIQAAKRTNPNYVPRNSTNYVYQRDKKWETNCQRCVPTYELLRRGYDVTALERIYGKSVQGRQFMTLDKVNGYLSVFKDPVITPIRMGTSSECRSAICDMMSTWGDGARAIVRVRWSGKNGKDIGGHVFIAEQFNGTTMFVDPQSGATLYGNKAFKDGAIIPQLTNLVRIDNLQFTDRITWCARATQ